jgi:hypothetical protein
MFPASASVAVGQNIQPVNDLLKVTKLTGQVTEQREKSIPEKNPCQPFSDFPWFKGKLGGA